MSLYEITDLAGLHRHLRAAMQLEHATIPPYLTALYSIKPGSNSEGFHILRTVAVEEMLHLTLTGNLLNAVGGKVDLTEPGFVPVYPAYLPDGETDFAVSCQKFSAEAIASFLRIERPASLNPANHPAGSGNLRRRKRKAGLLQAGQPGHPDQRGDEHFYSIGEFYKAIELGLDRLHGEMGDALFSGDPARQIGPEYYYSGGGGLIEVRDIATAKSALELIAEQGEGVTGHIFDEDDEISHYYRFQQLVLGRYYRAGDLPDQPSGGAVPVDWEQVWPIKTDARLSDYPPDSGLRRAAAQFNTDYGVFLSLLTSAFNGQPKLFIEAVGGMFRLKEQFGNLMRQPIPDGSGLYAAPTFEINAA